MLKPKIIDIDFHSHYEFKKPEPLRTLACAFVCTFRTQAEDVELVALLSVAVVTYRTWYR